MEPSDWSSMRAKRSAGVARDWGLTESSLRNWVEHSRADRTKGKTGLTTRGARGARATPERIADRSGGARNPEKSGGLLREAEPMRFTFIAAKRAEHTVTILCRCLRVTRSGFYAWHSGAESTHARDDRRLKVLVQASFHESKQRYGSPRVQPPAQGSVGLVEPGGVRFRRRRNGGLAIRFPCILLRRDK